MNYPSIERLAELQQMIADFAKVKRENIPLADNGRPENDVEHSYGLALTCWFLHPKIAPELDLLKIFQYAISHDIVEIHAGDTYIYDAGKMASKQKREEDALAVINDQWGDFPKLSKYAEGYMEKRDEEAKFVSAVDKILPVIMVDIVKPHNHWEKLNLTLATQREYKTTILVSDFVAPYYEKLLAWLDERGNIPKS